MIQTTTDASLANRGEASTGLGPPSARDHSRNNLDFLRLALAVAVILSHSYPLQTGDVETEPLLAASRRHVTLGAIAVDSFFVISGMLITRSWLTSRTAGSYLRKRVSRIYPGYVAAVAVSILIVAPVVSSAPNHRYLARLAVEAAVFDPPQSDWVLTTNPCAGQLNGSLWTIKYEFGCYLFVIAIAAVGLLRRRSAMLGLLGVVCLALFATRLSPYLSQRYFLFGDFSMWCLFTREFLIGMNVYLWRDRIPLRVDLFGLALAVAVGSFYVQPVEVSAAVFGVAEAYAVYYLAFAPWLPLQHFGRWGDLSYGTYLYAWLVQQLLVRYAHRWLTPFGLFAAAVPITLALAFLSWHLVERPFLRRPPRAEHGVAGATPDTLPAAELPT